MISTYLNKFTNLVMLCVNKYVNGVVEPEEACEMLILLSYTNFFRREFLRFSLTRFVTAVT